MADGSDSDNSSDDLGADLLAVLTALKNSTAASPHRETKSGSQPADVAQTAAKSPAPVPPAAPFPTPSDTPYTSPTSPYTSPSPASSPLSPASPAALPAIAADGPLPPASGAARPAVPNPVTPAQPLPAVSAPKSLTAPPASRPTSSALPSTTAPAQETTVATPSAPPPPAPAAPCPTLAAALHAVPPPATAPPVPGPTEEGPAPCRSSRLRRDLVIAKLVRSGAVYAGYSVPASFPPAASDGAPLDRPGRGPPSSPARGGLHVADVQGMDRPLPGAWGATATAVAGRVVVFGGVDSAGHPVRRVSELEVESGRWRIAQPCCPFGRYAHSAVEYKGKVVVFGGFGVGGLDPELRRLQGVVWDGDHVAEVVGCRPAAVARARRRFQQAVNRSLSPSPHPGEPATTLLGGRHVLAEAKARGSAREEPGGRDPEGDQPPPGAAPAPAVSPYAWPPGFIPRGARQPRRRRSRTRRRWSYPASAEPLGYLQDVVEVDGDAGAWVVRATEGPGLDYRAAHTAVQSGAEMVVFGGWGVSILEQRHSVDVAGPQAEPTEPPPDPNPGPPPPSAPLAHVVYSTVQWRRNDVAVLDCDTWRWRAVQTGGSLPSPRTDHCAVLQGGGMVVFGGVSYARPEAESPGDGEEVPVVFHNDVHRLDLAGWRWQCVQAAGDVPAGRLGASLAVWRGALLLHGGCHAGGVLGDVYQLSPDLRLWRRLEGADLPPRHRYLHAAVLLAPPPPAASSAPPSPTSCSGRRERPPFRSAVHACRPFRSPSPTPPPHNCQLLVVGGAAERRGVLGGPFPRCLLPCDCLTPSMLTLGPAPRTPAAPPRSSPDRLATARGRGQDPEAPRKARRITKLNAHSRLLQAIHRHRTPVAPAERSPSPAKGARRLGSKAVRRLVAKLYGNPHSARCSRSPSPSPATASPPRRLKPDEVKQWVLRFYTEAVKEHRTVMASLDAKYMSPSKKSIKLDEAARREAAARLYGRPVVDAQAGRWLQGWAAPGPLASDASRSRSTSPTQTAAVPLPWAPVPVPVPATSTAVHLAVAASPASVGGPPEPPHSAGDWPPELPETGYAPASQPGEVRPPETHEGMPPLTGPLPTEDFVEASAEVLTPGPRESPLTPSAQPVAVEAAAGEE